MSRIPAGGAHNEYLSGLDLQEIYGDRENRTMREKIARKVADIQHLVLVTDEDREWADQILTLLKQEIEKVENPYGEIGYGVFYGGFEQCRQAILEILTKPVPPKGSKKKIKT